MFCPGGFLGIVDLSAGGEPHDADAVVAGEEFQVVDGLEGFFAVLFDEPLHFLTVVDGHWIVLRQTK